MVTCELCGKECRTSQGLTGHKQWVHGIATANPQQRLEPTTKSAAKLELEELESRLELAELVAEQLAEELRTSGEQHAKQLNELQEQVAHHAKYLEEHASYLNKLTGLNDEVAEVGSRVGQLTDRLGRTIRVINGNKQVYDGMFENSQNGLDDVKSRLASHGHDDLKPVPDLIKKVGKLEQTLGTVQSQVEYLGHVAKRCPTGDVVKLTLTDEKEHLFRSYKSGLGLTRPHHVDVFLGDGYWVDLSEPDK